MPTNDNFIELIGDIRRGDPDAAREIVQRYESAIRVAVRTRLSDPALRRHFDSMDVCQSVLASFFLRIATGAYDLHEPRQLIALLTTMAQKKLAMRARSEFQQCRDSRRTRSAAGDEGALASSAPEPIRHAIGKELLDRALGMMSAEVRTIAERRVGGESWNEIAATMGGTADGRRKQYERAVSHIADVLDTASV